MQALNLLTQEIRETFHIKDDKCVDDNNCVICDQLLVLTDMSVPTDAIVGRIDSIKKINEIGAEYDFELNDDQYFMTYAKGDLINQYDEFGLIE
jgi:hypothetical protein